MKSDLETPDAHAIRRAESQDLPTLPDAMLERVVTKQALPSAASAIDARGRTIVPAAIRAYVGAKAGTRLQWHVLPDGRVLVRAKTVVLRDLAGSLKAPRGRAVSIDEMNAWAAPARKRRGGRK